MLKTSRASEPGEMFVFHQRKCLFFIKLDGSGINAIAEPRRGRSIGKYMPQMTTAITA
jgi:hypothetical protein